jgi:hypothetical protein
MPVRSHRMPPDRSAGVSVWVFLCGTVLTLKFLIMPLPWFWIMLLW